MKIQFILFCLLMNFTVFAQGNQLEYFNKNTTPLLRNQVLAIAEYQDGEYYISPSVKVYQKEVNGVVVQRNGHELVIYGVPVERKSHADYILFTHHRRDLLWASDEIVNSGTRAIVPKEESVYFTAVDSFWNDYSQTRYDNCHLLSMKINTHPHDVYRSVAGGDSITWQDQLFKVIDTPGYTRGAISYLAEIDSIKIAFVGDLIYGNGQIFDIYSLQDEFDEKKSIYHGFAARTGLLIKSLQKIRSLKPDLIIPSRGPIIKNPEITINKLIDQLQLLSNNYFSISAMRWVINQERLNAAIQKVQLDSSSIPWMPYAKILEKNNPSWLNHIGNSVLIRSKDSSAFLIDCGVEKNFNELMRLKKVSYYTDIEGIFITHYHNDHIKFVTPLQDMFNCPAYVSKEINDIIKRPQAYQMPCLIENSIENLEIMAEGKTMIWKEFRFTFHYFPGQTLYHSALMVENTNGGDPIFFIGDAFSPSGIDDYCLLNRNFIQTSQGYLYCLDFIDGLQNNVWLVNQHIQKPFKFSKNDIDFMRQQLLIRKTILKDLFPWEDPNFGIDEQWARLYPYSQEIKAGESATLQIVITNHDEYKNDFEVVINNNSKEFVVKPQKCIVSAQPKQEAVAEFSIDVPANTKPGIYVLTADISFNEWKLHEWSECLIKVSK